MEYTKENLSYRDLTFIWKLVNECYSNNQSIEQASREVCATFQLTDTERERYYHLVQDMYAELDNRTAYENEMDNIDYGEYEIE